MNGDVIKMQFPAKPDYILATRLAVSAIAERVGFGVDDIEDLKVASAEACGLLLASPPEKMDITVTVEGGLRIAADAVGAQQSVQNAEDDAGELSQYLLEALVDTCEVQREDGAVKRVEIYKKR